MLEDMVIRLIATDLDGTLLDRENQIPAANIRALRDALRRDVRLVLVSARRESSTSQVAMTLGLPCARIVHNGARTWDWDGAELRHFRLPLDLAHDIAAFSDEQKIELIITVDAINYYGGMRRKVRRDGDMAMPTNVAAIVGPPTRIIAAGPDSIDKLCERFGADPETLVVHRYYSRNGAVESVVMTHPRANKADALAELCRAHGIAAQDVLALGDAEADAEMLRWAGVGVAMGNAMNEALQAADWVAPSHDDAGFAAALGRFILSDLEQSIG
jgi:HAD superfamily hydrolase (TIGR01484 family)